MKLNFELPVSTITDAITAVYAFMPYEPPTA